MIYKFKATQTIAKFFSVEADNEDDALEKALTMAEEGEIHFDDEPFLNVEVQVKPLKWKPSRGENTFHTKVPTNAIKFKIKQPPMLNIEETLKQINYDDSWVEIL